jgi:hypothetical protein
MPVQRVYNLPSCTIRIDGISLGSSPILSILTNFECRFHHSSVSIIGGKRLLDNLIQSSSYYVQLLQTGNPVAVTRDTVQFEPANEYLHRLQVQPTDEDMPDPQPIEIQLNLVQLFDLVEGIDRLCTDADTLPDLTANIEPVSRVTKAKDVGFSALPAIVGVVSLAIASIGLSLIPIPPPKPKPQTQPISQPITPKPVPEISSSPLPEAIADPQLITRLQTNLKNQLTTAWVKTPTFSEDAVYQVAVNAKGEIVGYKPQGQAIANAEAGLPLRSLLAIPSNLEANPQVTTSFIVTFTPTGEVKVQELNR